MEKSFGYFQDDGREFVVTEANTPRGLINYLWNRSLVSGVSQHGGGEGVHGDRALQYVDRRGRTAMIRDGHRYFYLRDSESGTIWSPGWHPAQTDLDSFSCVHGLGYSIIKSELAGIQVELRVFIPHQEPAEIWTVSITNGRAEPAELGFYTFVDWLLQGYESSADYHSHLSGTYLKTHHAVHCSNNDPECPHRFFDAFVASNRAPTGYDTSRRQFLGNFGLVNRPRAVVEGQCRNSLAACEDLVGALEHKLTLAAGAEETFNIIIGASNGPDLTRKIVDRLRQDGYIREEFERLKEGKEQLRKTVLVETPDDHVNYLVNGWLKQQIKIYADVGGGSGRGFRDTMQLVSSASSFDADHARKILAECLRHQFQDGHTLRGWQPVDERHYSDGPVWIAPVVDAYVRETGDVRILQEEIPYFDGEKGTVWDHLLRGLLHATEDLGRHELVKCHDGDWNDALTGIGPTGSGESVWTSIAIVYSLKVAVHLARAVLRYDSMANELEKRADKLTDAINKEAWDGDWYLRAFDDAGGKVGSKSEREGRLYLLPQVWAILAEIVDDKRRDQLYQVIDGQLDSALGTLLLAPPYTRHNPKIGRLTAVLPGVWENGSVYNHANGFKIIADCMGGRGDEAWLSYQKAMPDSCHNPSTQSGCEPYAFAGQYLGPDNPRAGQTQFAWMTGAAGWYYRAMTEWILGVRAQYTGLLIDPCLPSAWTSCALERDFRGARYRIEIQNPKGLHKGSLSLQVDGVKIDGNLVPIFADDQLHIVVAAMS